MALSCKVGSFAKPNVTGNKAITGVGFQPKALILFGNIKTADGTAAADQYSFGCATASTENGSVGPDQHSSSYFCRQGSDKNYNLIVTTNNGRCSLTSFDADGFTNNWTSVTSPLGVVNYIALGGTSITGAKQINFTCPTSTGNQSITGVGFKPDSIIFFCMNTTGANSNSFANFGMSFVSATDSQSINIVQNSFGDDSVQKASAIVTCESSGDTINRDSSLVSMDEDGFTLNWSVVSASAMTVFALCIKGALVKVGVVNQKTSAGTQATTGVGFTPKLLMLASTNRIASAVINSSNQVAFSIGAASSTTERGTITGMADSTTAQNQYLDRTKIIQMVDFNSPYSVLAAADLNSFDADGFTLNWTTADAVARESIYLALGEPSGLQKASTGVSSIQGASTVL